MWIKKKKYKHLPNKKKIMIHPPFRSPMIGFGFSIVQNDSLSYWFSDGLSLCSVSLPLFPFLSALPSLPFWDFILFHGLHSLCILIWVPDNLISKKSVLFLSLDPLFVYPSEHYPFGLLDYQLEPPRFYATNTQSYIWVVAIFLSHLCSIIFYFNHILISHKIC